MRRRVLLLSINQYEFPYPVFPLGLAHIDAALRRAGYETRLVDRLADPRPLPEVLADFTPDFVGLSLRNIDDALIQRRETFFDDLQALCGELRELTRAPIILGGSGFSIFPQVLLERSGANFGIQGEGERQIVALMDALAGSGDYRDLPGLVYRNEDRIEVNPRNELVAPKEIALPDAGDGLMSYYLDRSSMLNLQTQRGCALHCCYCTYPLLEGRGYRRRPAESVVDELAGLQARGVNYVFIVDSVFNTSRTHVTEICEMILRRGVRMKWCCFLRPKNLTPELMGLMARAGLAHAEFGSDSFSDSVLGAYGKQLTFDDIYLSSELARKSNVDYAHFLICGGPGETLETLQESYLNSRRLANAVIMARVGMRVYPGTPLYQRLERAESPILNTDLLQPTYYVEPPLTEEQVFDRLRAFAAESPNWIFDDPPPSYFKMAERLRSRGVVGPLWAYFAMMQRLGSAFSAAPERVDG